MQPLYNQPVPTDKEDYEMWLNTHQIDRKLRLFTVYQYFDCKAIKSIKIGLRIDVTKHKFLKSHNFSFMYGSLWRT